MRTAEQLEIAALKKEVRHLKLLLQEATALLRKIMDFADKYEDLEIPPTPVQKRRSRKANQKTLPKRRK